MPKSTGICLQILFWFHTPNLGFSQSPLNQNSFSNEFTEILLKNYMFDILCIYFIERLYIKVFVLNLIQLMQAHYMYICNNFVEWLLYNYMLPWNDWKLVDVFTILNKFIYARSVNLVRYSIYCVNQIFFHNLNYSNYIMFFIVNKNVQINKTTL